MNPLIAELGSVSFSFKLRVFSSYWRSGRFLFLSAMAAFRRCTALPLWPKLQMSSLRCKVLTLGNALAAHDKRVHVTCNRDPLLVLVSELVLPCNQQLLDVLREELGLDGVDDLCQC